MLTLLTQMMLLTLLISAVSSYSLCGSVVLRSDESECLLFVSLLVLRIFSSSHAYLAKGDIIMYM